MNSIYNYSREKLDTYFLNKGLTKYRSTQVFEALYKQQVKDFFEITNLKLELREELSGRNFSISSLDVVREQNLLMEQLNIYLV